jgi:hypothetical protein
MNHPYPEKMGMFDVGHGGLVSMPGHQRFSERKSATWRTKRCGYWYCEPKRISLASTNWVGAV